MSKILIKNGRVRNGEAFFKADILTEGKKIYKIEECIEESADFVYNAEGETISAGFVDIHTHMKGISGEEFGISAEMVTLPFGVTAAADASACYGSKEILDFLTVKNCVFVCVELKNNRAYFESALACLEKYGDKAVGVKVYLDTGVSDV